MRASGQQGGDAPASYFSRTECVAGVQDMRFQELMPDVLHWLGITQHRPLRLDERHEVRRARRARHHVGERVPMPEELVPADARVEIEAKLAAGYFAAARAFRIDAPSTGRAFGE